MRRERHIQPRKNKTYGEKTITKRGQQIRKQRLEIQTLGPTHLALNPPFFFVFFCGVSFMSRKRLFSPEKEGILLIFESPPFVLPSVLPSLSHFPFSHSLSLSQGHRTTSSISVCTAHPAKGRAVHSADLLRSSHASRSSPCRNLEPFGENTGVRAAQSNQHLPGLIALQESEEMIPHRQASLPHPSSAFKYDRSDSILEVAGIAPR